MPKMAVVQYVNPTANRLQLMVAAGTERRTEGNAFR